MSPTPEGFSRFGWYVNPAVESYKRVEARKRDEQRVGPHVAALGLPAAETFVQPVELPVELPK